MTFRSTPGWLVLPLLVAGCSPPLGRVLVTVIFENENRTQCIRASARNASGAQVNASPAALARSGKDTLLLGLGETAELVGEVRVTIARFTSPDCSGTAFASESKTTDVVRGAATAMLEFRYSGEGDGGLDGGMDAGSDGGVDAGCDPSACENAPGECELAPAMGCAPGGGCRYGFRPAQTACSTGVCNTMGTCISNVCTVLDAGMPCDDGLPCTSTSSCAAGACVGNCGPAPACNLNVQPLTCDPVTPTTCALRPALDFSSCPLPGGRCISGACLPWLQFSPINFPTGLPDLPYPTAAWNLASPDGGICDTVVSTTGSVATVMLAECGSPNITSTVNDAGVAVITTRGLDVGPKARLHFVGTRPVQLVVIGDARIQGVVSAAPILGGQQPAGTGPAACSTNPALPGTGGKQGGGGGGLGGVGGQGGDSGGFGGAGSSSFSPLRGGCPGAAGFRPAGMSAPGTGGGALQLIVADTLTLSGGVVTASGGGGLPGNADNEGGGGGGSGGTIILEARIINLTGGAVTANGGGGGEGGDTNATSAPGALGPISSAQAAPVADSNMAGNGGVGGVEASLSGGPGGSGNGSRGGGGGGGAAGLIFIRGTEMCVRGGSAGAVVSGGQPMPFACP